MLALSYVVWPGDSWPQSKFQTLRKEAPLAAVHAEVKELVDEIRKYGFTAAIEGDGYQIYKDGQRVIGDHGTPIKIHLTPSDQRWRKNKVAELIRSSVLPHDPKKEGQMKQARAERPEEVQAMIDKRRQHQIEKANERWDREREKMRPIFEAARKLTADLEATQADMAKLMEQVAKESGITPPSLKAIVDHMSSVLGENTKKGHGLMTPIYERMWRAVFDKMGVTLGETDEKRKERMEDLTGVDEKGRPVKTPHGHRIAPGLLPIDPKNPNRCVECGFVAKELRGLRAHQRGHTKTTCRFCGAEVMHAGIGQHERFCLQNPNRLEAKSMPRVKSKPTERGEKVAETKKKETPYRPIERSDDQLARLAKIGGIIDEWFRGDAKTVVSVLITGNLDADNFKELIRLLV